MNELDSRKIDDVLVCSYFKFDQIDDKFVNIYSLRFRKGCRFGWRLGLKKKL